MFLNWLWNKMWNLKVDGQLFLCMGGFLKERGEKSWRINDFRSEWICQKPSALFTLPLSTHGGPEPLGLPAQGETGHSGSPVCTSGSQLEKRGGTKGGGAIFCVVKPPGRLGWHTETPAQRVSDQCTICQAERERREEHTLLNSSVSARVAQIRKTSSPFKAFYVPFYSTLTRYKMGRISNLGLLILIVAVRWLLKSERFKIVSVEQVLQIICRHVRNMCQSSLLWWCHFSTGP